MINKRYLRFSRPSLLSLRFDLFCVLALLRVLASASFTLSPHLVLFLYEPPTSYDLSNFIAPTLSALFLVGFLECVLQKII